MIISNKSDVTISELVEQIRRGELMLPKLQRRYVWRATKVRDLLDSLYRGYPSGSILVWNNCSSELSRELDVNQSGNGANVQKLLLDGQQRLTSLSAVIRGEPVTVRNRKRPIDILFNLDHPDTLQESSETDDDALDNEELDEEGEEFDGNIVERLRSRTFVVASKALSQQPNWVSVTEVFKRPEDTNKILRRIGITSLDDPRFNKYSERLKLLLDIRHYSFSVNTISRNVAYPEVAEIFVRVNSLGVKLRGSDLALALITAKWPESLDILEEFQDECDEMHINFDLGLLVRAMVIFATQQSRFLSVSTISAKRLQEGWAKAKSGLYYAINFLKENCGVIDESLLSSPMIYLLVAYYSQKKNERLSQDEINTLKYWVYISSARGRYARGSTETLLDADLRAVDKEDGLVRLLDNLKQQMGRLDFESSDFKGRNINSGLFSLMYLVLKDLGAQDWTTGLEISTRLHGNQHKIEFHHIFPKSLLKGQYEKQEIHELANLAFISERTNKKISNKTPAEYLPNIIGDRGEDVLVKQCITLDRDLYQIASFREFLAVRREALALAVNNFTGRVRPSWLI